MRLWHRSLIPYLPRQQLLAQWRECCAICSNWAKKGTPNHILVNKVLEYPTAHFWIYSAQVLSEMNNRGYRISKASRNNFEKNYDCFNDNCLDTTCLFNGWHNDRYLKQCLCNLQEKYDCGGIPEREWKAIEDEFEGWM